MKEEEAHLIVAERRLERDGEKGIEKHVCARDSEKEGEEEEEERGEEGKAGEEVKGDTAEREEN